MVVGRYRKMILLLNYSLTMVDSLMLMIGLPVILQMNQQQPLTPMHYS